MQFFSMDETLIKINELKNLEDVSLTFIKNKIPCLIVFYDGGRNLSITSDENYFKEFIRKVKDLYIKEKSEGKKISIDDDTADILENGNLDNINDIYSYYSDKCIYDESLLFELDKVKSLIDIVKYHLRELFSKTNINVNFDDEVNGYRTYYTINGKIDGYNSLIKMAYRQIGNNNYEFRISGIIKGFNEVVMNIKFNKESIEVNINIPGYNLYSESKYIALDNGVKSFNRVYENYITLYMDDKELESTQKPEGVLVDFDSSSDLKWYKLPWGACYGIDIKSRSLGTNQEYAADLKTKHDEELKSIRTMYVSSNGDIFVKRDNYSKSYIIHVDGMAFSEEIILDKMSKNVLCTRVDDNSDVYAIETQFINLRGIDGYYDEHLEGNYYYHVASASSIDEIDESSIKSVDKDSVLYKKDLLNKDIVLKMGDK